MYCSELGSAKASAMHLKVLQHLLYIIHFLFHEYHEIRAKVGKNAHKRQMLQLSAVKSQEINYNYDTSSQNTTTYYFQLHILA